MAPTGKDRMARLLRVEVGRKGGQTHGWVFVGLDWGWSLGEEAPLQKLYRRVEGVGPE